MALDQGSALLPPNRDDRIPIPQAEGSTINVAEPFKGGRLVSQETVVERIMRQQLVAGVRD